MLIYKVDKAYDFYMLQLLLQELETFVGIMVFHLAASKNHYMFELDPYCKYNDVHILNKSVPTQIFNLAVNY